LATLFSSWCLFAVCIYFIFNTASEIKPVPIPFQNHTLSICITSTTKCKLSWKHATNSYVCYLANGTKGSQSQSKMWTKYFQDMIQEQCMYIQLFHQNAVCTTRMKVRNVATPTVFKSPSEPNQLVIKPYSQLLNYLHRQVTTTFFRS
jgi:hypothetical protein